jgi:predicted pyridoxine 5'-phosphate oxidase superfamily flavin-nucleotide-binding protein
MYIPDSLVKKLNAGSDEIFITYLITSSKQGVPNVLSIPFSDVLNNEFVLLPDLFAIKSKVNLNENNRAALSFYSEKEKINIILLGIADIIQWGHPANFKLFGLKAGEILKRYGDWDAEVESVIDAKNEFIIPTVYAQRGVIVFKTENILET